MRLCCAVLLMMAFCAATVGAQDRWVFVPATVVGSEGAPATLRLESAIADPRVTSNRAAATMVAARDSSEAPQLDEREIRRALDLVTRATQAIRMGDKNRVGLRQLKELERLAAPVQDYLQRDGKRAELLFQACVLAGGLLLKAKQPTEAHEQMRSCARIYPGRKPQAAPEVVTAFSEAASEVAAEPHGALDVEGGEGCGVRLNGALVGTSPLHMEAVRVGTARVQLECGDAQGRIHGINISPGSNRVTIDPDFERALSTSDGLTLTYADDAARERAMRRHGQALGDILEAHVVLLVPTGTKARALSLQPYAELGTLSTGSIPADVVRAIKATIGPPAPPPAPIAQNPELSGQTEPLGEPGIPDPPPFVPRSAPLRDEGKGAGQVIAAGAMIAVGIGSWVAAWTFYATRASAGAMPDASRSYAARSAFRHAGTMALAFAAGGGALLAASEYLLLPNEVGVPTIAWAWGGAGLLLAASGLALMIAETPCALPVEQCRGFTDDVILGPMLMLHAIPLLSVPLNFALHDWLRPRRRIELGLHGTEATFTVYF